MEQKQIEAPSGSAATGSLPYCYFSGRCLGLTLGFPTFPLHTHSLLVQLHQLPVVTLLRSCLQIGWYAYILLCYLVVDVHVSQANAELPSTSDHSTVGGCPPPLQVKDGAHVLKQGRQLYMERVSLPCHAWIILSLCPSDQ